MEIALPDVEVGSKEGVRLILLEVSISIYFAHVRREERLLGEWNRVFFPLGLELSFYFITQLKNRRLVRRDQGLLATDVILGVGLGVYI